MKRIWRSVLVALSARARLAQLVAAADAANRRGDWQAAEAGYAAALRIRPDMADILVQYGHALKEQGFLHRAARAYTAAAAHAPEAIDPVLQLARVETLIGRPGRAAEAYRAALRLDPESAVARAELAGLGAVREDARHGPGPHEALLERHDLTPAVLSIFDAAFYRAQPGFEPGDGAPDLAAALRHFGTQGIDALAPVNARSRFDPDFYRRTYLDGRPLAPARAYRHWLNVGLARGWWPSRAAWLEALAGPLVERFGPAAAEAIKEESEREPSDIPFLPLFDDPSGDTASWRSGFLAAVAGGLFRAGQPARALALQDRILERWPDCVVARRDRAGSRLALGDAAQARAGLEALDRRLFTVASFGDLAACHEALGATEAAIEVLGDGLRAYPGDAGLRRRFAAGCDRAIHAAWRAAEQEAAAGDPDPARGRLAALLATVVANYPASDAASRMPIRSVAIVGNLDLPQCRLYRLDQKLEQLSLAGFEAVLYDELHDVPRFLAEMTRHQAVIFYRVPVHFHIIDAILTARAAGLATIYEIDDLMFDAAHSPGSFESFGGQISRADYVGLQLAAPMYAGAMALCDYGIASTPALAGAMRPIVRSGAVSVHRNALGRLHERQAATAAPLRTDGPVVVFYGSGTKAHTGEVAALVEQAFVALVGRYGAGVSIVLAGHATLTPALAALGDRVTLLDPLPVERYWVLLASVDINLAVLAASIANDAKSEIKWLEAAMFGVPSVVSATATYREVIEHGVTGFLCATPEDWTATLDRLVGDAALRKRVGAAARDQVLRRYGMEEAVRNLQAILRTLDPPPVPARPKVLIVNVFYPPQAYGGATRVVHDNVLALRQAHADAFDIQVFTSIDGGERPYEVGSYAQDGVRVTGITTPAGADAAVEDPAMGRAFASVLEAVRPGLVHFHCIQRLSVSVVDAARAAGIPYLITVHDGWWISSTQFLLDEAMRLAPYDYGHPVRVLEQQGSDAYQRLLGLQPALMGARAVLAVSDRFGQLHAACGVPNVRTVENGVSADLRPNRIPAPDGRVRLGYVGGFHAYKGWPLIRAALETGRWRNLTLLVVDNAMTPGEIREETWGSTSVTVRPGVAHEDVASLYGEIDVLLAPSICVESFGLVTREALLCGCWVIASDRGSIGEPVIEGVNGFLVDVASPAGLIEALQRIDGDPQRYRAAPPPGERPIRSSVHQAEDLAVLYRSLLGTAGAASGSYGD